MQVDGSPYGGMAYCEVFPRDYDPNSPGNKPGWPIYLAQVCACVLRVCMYVCAWVCVCVWECLWVCACVSVRVRVGG